MFMINSRDEMERHGTLMLALTCRETLLDGVPKAADRFPFAALVSSLCLIRPVSSYHLFASLLVGRCEER